jgi:CRISPR-associated protein Csx17
VTKIYVHELTGLKPDALATYLAGLGVFRLLAEQRDPEVRALWRDEHFVLVTRLDANELQEFFLHQYKPSPIMAPWSGGGGFLDANGDDDTTNSRPGSPIEELATYAAPRFTEIQQAIERARSVIPSELVQVRAQRDCLTAKLHSLRRERRLAAESTEYHELNSRLEALQTHRDAVRKKVEEVKNKVKATLLQRLSTVWSGKAREWFDACVILDESGLPGYAWHLGSGGNEGNQDYTAGFQANIACLFQPDGKPSPGAEKRLKVALLGDTAPVLDPQAAGQFSPGRAGGTNMGVGFEGSARVNPWEFVLMLEGAIAIVSGLSRRGEVGRASVSSPFWVEAAAAGFGSASEREGAPRGEQWLPLWSQPLRYTELVELIREGRAQVGRQQTTRAADLVRATARLGLARGIDSLQRFAYLERNGQSHLAVFTGRFHVRSRSHQELLDDVAPWIDRLVRHAKQTKENNVPASLGAVARRTQEALFLVCRREATARDWRDLLIALGEAEFALLRSGKSLARRPLPTLGAGWIDAVDDLTPKGRSALRLALALASQHRFLEHGRGKFPFDEHIRRHFMPIDDRGRFALDERGRPKLGPEQICVGRDLVADAIALVERRSIWARSSKKERERTPRLPLQPIPGCEVTLEEVGAWIRGEISDREVLDLVRPLLALDWKAVHQRAEAVRGPLVEPIVDGTPEPLHLLFRLAHLPFDVPVTDTDGRNEVAVGVRLDPEPLRRLAAGDLDGALRVAVRRLEASGLRPVFRRTIATPSSARRVAASLGFPISQQDAARAARLVCKPYAVKDVEESPAVPA